MRCTKNFLRGRLSGTLLFWLLALVHTKASAETYILGLHQSGGGSFVSEIQCQEESQCHGNIDIYTKANIRRAVTVYGIFGKGYAYIKFAENGRQLIGNYTDFFPIAYWKSRIAYGSVSLYEMPSAQHSQPPIDHPLGDEIAQLEILVRPLSEK